MKKFLIIAAFGMCLQLTAMPVFDKPVETEVCDQFKADAICNFSVTAFHSFEMTPLHVTTYDLDVPVSKDHLVPSLDDYQSVVAFLSLKHFYHPRIYDSNLASWHLKDDLVLIKIADQPTNIFREPLPDIGVGQN